MGTIIMKIMSFLLPVILLFSGAKVSDFDYSDKLNEPDYVGLKDVYADYFDVGCAVGGGHCINERDFILKNFNSLTFEASIKQPYINPKEGVWNFGDADVIANFARENNLKVRGHCLLWPAISNDSWMVYDNMTDKNFVDKDTFYKRLDDFFRVVMTRYGDVVSTWDVVNEQFYWDATQDFKETEITKIVGSQEELIKNAFFIAKKYVRDDAKLCINECKVVYSPAKLAHLYKYVKKWLAEGVPIDAVGIQCHWEVLNAKENARQLDKAIKKIASLGVDIQITEMTMNCTNKLDSLVYDPLPRYVEILQTKKWKEEFKVFRDNADVISSVTFWGVSDKYNNTSKNKPDYPMLFDKDNKPKESYWAVIDF